MFIKILKFFRNDNMSFSRLAKKKKIFLYAGDIGIHTKNGPVPFIGLSLTQFDRWHIKHDVRHGLQLSDNSVSIYQSEDVFEHLEYDELLPVINEVFRVLKPGGLFRLSLPDYRCDILENRALKDESGKIIYDPGGGGSYHEGRVIEGGHLWFPIIELVTNLMQKSDFMANGKIDFLHYYDANSNSITKTIDHSKGVVSRTPDFDKRVQEPRRAMSIVIDAYKV